MKHLIIFTRSSARFGFALLLAMPAQPGLTVSPRGLIISGGVQEEHLVGQAGNSVYLDQNCQRTTEGWDTWKVEYRRTLDVGGQQYWFSRAQYQDGASLLCISRPGYLQGKRLPVSQLQSRFIGQVKQEGNMPSFLVIVNDGNGRLVTLTQYRLGLDNPSRPSLVKLRQWQGSPL
jgi:hypothetical protein